MEATGPAGQGQAGQGEAGQGQAARGPAINAAALCRRPPLVSLIYACLGAALALAFFIACLVVDKWVYCPLSWYGALNGEAIFQRGEVWRLLTTHVLVGEFWQAVLFTDLFPFGFMLEIMVGSWRYLGLLLYGAVVVDLVTCAVSALLRFTPGLNEWDYFFNQWSTYSNQGPSPMMLYITIVALRAMRIRTIPYMCCSIPAWGYILITWFFCQIFIDPFWYGLFYVASGALAAYCVPMPWLAPRLRAEDLEAGTVLNPGAAPRRGCRKRRQPASRAPQPPALKARSPARDEWGGAARTLGSAEVEENWEPEKGSGQPVHAPAPAATPAVNPAADQRRQRGHVTPLPGAGARPEEDPWGTGRKL